ncbi:MAG: succinate dehydrogenase/fumarate reductase flavoprotein subunit [Acidilobaceae archaeon]
MEILRYDILILGSGLAGLRAALQASIVSNGKLRIAVISKVQAMRSHSVAAEGGISGVLYPKEYNDSFSLHAYDTVKGSDFLADQDAVEILARLAPEEIRFFDHLGTPWSRLPDGRIAQRPFGGMSVPRTAYAADKTGFFMMSTLYSNLQRFDNVEIFHEHIATSILLENGVFRGFTVLDLESGEMNLFLGKAGIIATGGGARVYSFTTVSQASTGDGIAIAYRAGIPVKDMEFVQFHPTALIPSGTLITEAARGEGGYLINRLGERFMKRYAPQKMELAPRDIISRAMITEIIEGRGLRDEESGLDYLYLDLRHLGERVFRDKLPMIREITRKLINLDPLSEPIPVLPAAHYTMGGIHVDTYGQVMLDDKTPIPNLWAAGEVAAVSIHGANRLGSNALSECVVWGRITGSLAADYALKAPDTMLNISQIVTNKAREEESRVFDRLIHREVGGENPYLIKRELQRMMDDMVGIFRDGSILGEAWSKLKRLKERMSQARLEYVGKTYNNNLRDILEINNMISVAETIIVGAITRRESRGAHYRLDYPSRDDTNYLKHTIVYYRVGEEPIVTYTPVRITLWKPEERRY